MVEDARDDYLRAVRRTVEEKGSDVEESAMETLGYPDTSASHTASRILCDLSPTPGAIHVPWHRITSTMQRTT